MCWPVPENIHTPPKEGIRISWGGGASVRPKLLNKCIAQLVGGGGGVFSGNWSHKICTLNPDNDIATNLLFLRNTRQTDKQKPECLLIKR